MIDKAVFTEEWSALLVRFGRKVDDANTEQGRRFYAFLSPQMDTDSFVRAARAVWATSRFFPRPADFLVSDAGGVWGEIVSLLSNYRAPGWGIGMSAQQWWDAWKALPEAARDSLEGIGDVEQLVKLYLQYPLKLRERWQEGFEQARVTSAVAALPKPRGTRELPASVQ